MNEPGFGPAVLELASRGDCDGVLDLDPTDEEAEILLAVLHEVDVEMEARDIGAQMRQMGYLR